jgi:hypothetical protein
MQIILIILIKMIAQVAIQWENYIIEIDLVNITIIFSLIFDF